MLKAVSRDRFPRINAAVDICNYLSLKTLCPISVWDADRADGETIRFRLGRAGEWYVFNEGGQEIDLTDLVVVVGDLREVLRELLTQVGRVDVVRWNLDFLWWISRRENKNLGRDDPHHRGHLCAGFRITGAETLGILCRIRPSSRGSVHRWSCGARCAGAGTPCIIQ